jgi:hypothetical protein
MSTIIRLTYSANGKSTLLNLSLAESIYRFFDKNTNRLATRINFPNDRYVIVDEELQDIQRLIQEHEQGKYQSTDWVDTGINIEDRMQQDYDQNTGAYNSNYRPRQPYRNHRERTYNSW